MKVELINTIESVVLTLEPDEVAAIKCAVLRLQNASCGGRNMQLRAIYDSLPGSWFMDPIHGGNARIQYRNS